MAQKFCSNCGAPLPDNARFCGTCGQPVQQGQSAAPVPTFNYTQQKRHSRIVTSSPNGVPVIGFRDLHPNATWLFFFSFLGKTFILVVLFGLTAFVEPLVALIMSVSYLIILFLIARMLYKNYQFEITENAFHKVHGVFHKRNVSIPIEQIQNVNLRRSVIDQMLGLSHVDIETAGESGANGRGRATIGGLYSPAEGYIPGISPNEAKDIRDLLLARMQQTD